MTLVPVLHAPRPPQDPPLPGRREPSLAVVGAVLASLGLACLYLVLAAWWNPTPRGYIENPYTAVPWWTWALVVVSSVAGWALVLGPYHGRVRAMGAFINYGAGLALVVFFRAMGMASSNGEDMFTHVGWARDVMRTGRFDADWYPAMHVWDALLADGMDMDLLTFIGRVHVPVLFTVFALGVGLLARWTVPLGNPARRFHIGLSLGAIPFGGSTRYFEVTTGTWLYLLAPMAVAVLVRVLRDPEDSRWEWALLSVLWAILFAFVHPMSLLLFALLVPTVTGTAWIVSARSQRKSNLPYPLAFTFLGISTFVGLYWTLSTRLGEQTLRQIMAGFDTIGANRIESGVQRVQGFGFSSAEIARKVFFDHAPIILLAFLALAGFVLLLRGRRLRLTKARERTAIAMGLVGYLFLLLFLVSKLVDDFGVRGHRFRTFSAIFFVPLAATLLAWTTEGPLVARRAAAICAAVIVSTIALFGALQSPIGSVPWDAVPASEVEAGAWLVEAKPDDKLVFVGPASNGYRYAHMFLGVAGTRDMAPHLDRYAYRAGPWSNNYQSIPDHFAFSDEAAGFVCGGAVGAYSIVFLPASEIMPYGGVWQPTGRFTNEELTNWGESTGGSRIYDAGPLAARAYLTPRC